MSDDNSELCATITAQFTARSVIDRESLASYYGDGQPATLQEAVTDIIKEEGLFGIVDYEFTIVQVTEVVCYD